jgi:hypothetical protein
MKEVARGDDGPLERVAARTNETATFGRRQRGRNAHR